MCLQDKFLDSFITFQGSDRPPRVQNMSLQQMFRFFRIVLQDRVDHRKTFFGQIPDGRSTALSRPDMIFPDRIS